MDGKPDGFSGKRTLHWADQSDGSPWKAEADQRTADGWRVRSVWVEQNSVPVLRELHITPSNTRRVPERGLTARRLDKLGHEAKLAMMQKRAAEFFADEPRALADFDGLIHGDRKRLGGARGRSDLDYARIAIRYEQLVQTSDRPIVALAGELVLTQSAVSSLVHECRRRKLLSAASRGRASGRATANAHRLVETAKKT